MGCVLEEQRPVKLALFALTVRWGLQLSTAQMHCASQSLSENRIRNKS
jgi:hypothetical protein